MTITFYAQASDASLASSAFCSGRSKDAFCYSNTRATNQSGPVQAQAISAGSSAANTVVIDIEGAPGVDAWAAGTYVVTINVTVANMNLTLTEIHLCRVTSAGAAVATIGSLTGIGRVLSPTGSVNHNVTGSADTHSTTDLLEVLLVLSNGAMSTQSATIEVTIASPIVGAGGSAPKFRRKMTFEGSRTGSRRAA